ncbi:hypothetical protein BC628DRAFT_1502218 [Trametes gibbosa]|nr:hypothetical protein BC628DRAFT_1502218 [Trametes gibbosa]
MSSNQPPAPAPRPAAGANPNSVANQNVERLKAAIKGIESIKQELWDVRKEAKVREDILYSKLKLQEAELGSMQRRMRYLEKLVGFPGSDEEEGSGGQPQSMGTGTENEPQGAGTDGAQLPSAEQVAKSRHWQDKKEIKDVVALALKKLMNITALDAKKLPPYPARDEPWPMHPQVADERLVWFDWAMTEDGDHNRDALEMVRKWIRTNGAIQMSSSALALAEIFDSDLMRRIVAKFQYMRSEFRRIQKLHAVHTKTAAPVGTPLGDGDDGFGADGFGGGEGTEGVATEEVVEVVVDTVQRAIYRSRAEPKLAARKRKVKGTEWDTPKYEAALSINATSDDEDDPAPVPGEPLKFISRPPWYRSDEASASDIA